MAARLSLFVCLLIAAPLAAEPVAGVTTLSHEWNVNAVAFSPDGRLLAAAGEGREKTGEVTLWDAATAKPLFQLFGNDSAVEKVAFGPDGKTLATTSRERLMIWELPSGKLLSVTPNGIFLGKHGCGQVQGGSLRCWNLDDRKFPSACWQTPVKDAYLHQTRSTLSPDGEQLALLVHGARFGVVILHNLNERITFSPRDFGGEIECFAFSPNNEVLAMGTGGGLCLWNLQTGKLKGVLAFTGDGDGEADC